MHPERIAKSDRRMVNDLDYVDIKSPVSRKDYCKIEQKNSICINVFSYENDLVYPVHVSDKILIEFNKILRILIDFCVIRQKK